MFKKDIDIVQDLHKKYQFKGPLIDAGGLESPTIADYDISVNSAIDIFSPDGRIIKVPNSFQEDRYLKISRPWSFIDPNYIIANPEKGDPIIEELPKQYTNYFETVILVSVFEHVNDPYEVSDALYKIVKPGGYLFNSTPFLFPYHPSPEDNFRYSPVALKRIHESSGFKWIEGHFHINYSSKDGIGDTNPNNYGAPQAIMASYALFRKE